MRGYGEGELQVSEGKEGESGEVRGREGRGGIGGRYEEEGEKMGCARERREDKDRKRKGKKGADVKGISIYQPLSIYLPVLISACHT